MRDVLVVSLARASVIVGQLAYVKLYSHYLSAYELGVYFFLITVSYSLNALIFVPVDYYQQSRLYEFLNNGISLRPFLLFNAKLFRWFGIVAITGSVIFSFFSPTVAIYCALTVGTALSLYASQALRGMLNNLEHKRIAAVSLIFEALLKIVLLWILLRFMSPNAMTLLASWTIVLTLVAGFLGWQTQKLGIFSKGRETLEKIHPADISRFAYPISIGAVFNWIQLQGYRLVLVPLGFAETVGVYATVANIGSAGMGGVASVFGQMFVPNIYKTSGKYTGTYLRNAFFLIGFIFVFSLIFSDLIVSLVTNDSFAKYSWILLFGIIAEAGNFIIGALSIHITITTSTKKMLNASIIGAVSMVIIFSGIYYGDMVTVQTVGVPIVISQLLVVAYMVLAFRKYIIIQKTSLEKC